MNRESGQATLELVTLLIGFIAVFLGLIAILPYILAAILRTNANSTMLLSSSGLLIVVGCVRDIIDYLESELNQRGYDEKLIR